MGKLFRRNTEAPGYLRRAAIRVCEAVGESLFRDRR